MAAVLSADMDHTDKVVTLIKEALEIGLQVKPPDVNHSLYEFAVGWRADHSLRAWAPCAGWGGARLRKKEAATRSSTGRYKSIEDLSRRSRSAEGQPTGAGGIDPLRQPGRTRCESRNPHATAARGDATG